MRRHRPPVHSETGHRPWLAAWLAWRQATDPSFSHRKFIAATGDKNPSVLHHVIHAPPLTGRPLAVLTEAWGRRWVAELGLDREETELFLAMVNEEWWYWQEEKWRTRTEARDGARRWANAGHERTYAAARLAQARREVAARRGVARGADVLRSGPVAGAVERLAWGVPAADPSHLSGLRRHAEAAPAAMLRCLPAPRDAPLPLFGLTAAMAELGWAELVDEVSRFAAEVVGALHDPIGPVWHVRLVAFPSSDARNGPSDTSTLSHDPVRGDEPEVFAFEDPVAWLRAWVAWRRATRTTTLSALSRRLVDHPIPGATGALSRLLRGDLRLGAAWANRLGALACLSEPEAVYLEALATLGTARGDARDVAQARVRALRAAWETTPGRTRRLGSLRNGMAFTLVELARCAGFSPDPASVARQLRPAVDPTAAAEQLELLRAAGFPLDPGAPPPSEDFVLPIGPREYYLDMLALEVEVLRRAEWQSTTEQVAASALTLPVARGRPAVHDLLHGIAQRLLRLVSRHAARPTRVYQVNLHGFTPT